LPGFECYVCDKAVEMYENEKKRAQDPSTPPIKPKYTDGRKFACPAPEPFKKPKELDWYEIRLSIFIQRCLVFV